MDISISDITVHIDETLTPDRRTLIEKELRALNGVVSVHNSDNTPHLTVVGFNPEATSSDAILGAIRRYGVGAELIGL